MKRGVVFQICDICTAIFKLLGVLTSCDSAKGTSHFAEHRNSCRKVLDPKPPTGGILSEGVLAAVEGPGLVVDEFQQLNRSPKSKQYPSTSASTPPLRRFLPQQTFLARAAVLILRARVWGQPAPMSAISFLPETEPAQESTGPFLAAKMLELSIRLRPRRAKIQSPLRDRINAQGVKSGTFDRSTITNPRHLSDEACNCIPRRELDVNGGVIWYKSSVNSRLRGGTGTGVWFVDLVYFKHCLTGN